METNLNQVILTELRELRAAVDELAADARQRLSTLEAHDKDIYGNGQPGRMSEVESRIRKLEHWKVYLLGAAAAVAVVIDFLLKLL